MIQLTKALAISLAVLAAPCIGSARETATKRPPAYTAPPETARFITAPGVEVALRHCLICHSADYVNTQPPNMPPAFWQNEVAKMRNAYGAHLSDEDAKAVADYLVSAYSEPTAGRK